jgi:hypothetical protein
MAAMGLVSNGAQKMSSPRGIREVSKPTDRRDDVKTREMVTQGTDTPELHEAERLAALETESRSKLESLLEFLRTGAQQSELHEVEREVLTQLLGLGRTLLQVFLATKGTGKVPAGRVAAPSGEELPYHSIKRCGYASIFGEVEIRRAYYWGVAQKGLFPLDAELNLPEQRYSYLLQEWGELLGTDGSFEKVTERLETLFRVKFWSQGVQHVAHAAAESVQPFYEQLPAPAAATEGELLVATIDGKGVPIRPEEPQGRKLRIGPGEKPNKKKEAVVSAVYTIDRYPRTPEDVIREIDTENRIVAPDPPPPPRPRPKNKRMRATMQGKKTAFDEMRRHLDERDPTGEKQRVALTDGAEPLQEGVLTQLAGSSGIVLILDIMHVLTYLWPVAFAYYKEGSADASRWVMHKLHLLLEGKVGYVIGTLRQRLALGGLSRSKQRDFKKAIAYMERNRTFMAYDLYLAEGYPIGSGVAEGGCKHLVGDRMESTGMRWSLHGAQAILDLRSVSINGDWEAFWRFHAAREKARLYGPKHTTDSVRNVA